MSRTRIVITVLLVLCLAMLFAWQRRREALMAECLSRGNYWNGPKSTCEPTPYAPIIKRALERS